MQATIIPNNCIKPPPLPEILANTDSQGLPLKSVRTWIRGKVKGIPLHSPLLFSRRGLGVVKPTS